MKEAYKIIKSLIRTEKGSELIAFNKYLFMVSMPANKMDITRAVEALYKVKVTGVNVVKMRGKKKRIGQQAGRTPDWKKAVVTLKSGDTIEMAT